MCAKQRKYGTFAQYFSMIFLTAYLYPLFAVGISTCVNTPEMQMHRTKELQQLTIADQADREQPWEKLTEDELNNLLQRDLIRRKRVGEIFGEGCFSTTKDYLNAALIYQHGDTSDHYYQAFIWSKKASELDSNAQHLVSLTIDRYLLSIGRKQLFGSQYFKKTFQDKCYCMQPVEESFPDSQRKQYSGRSLNERYQKMAEINPPDCSNSECDTLLQATPKGSIIGFW